MDIKKYTSRYFRFLMVASPIVGFVISLANQEVNGLFATIGVFMFGGFLYVLLIIATYLTIWVIKGEIPKG